jgi:Kef-type K+ transport system membrane component KefB
MGEFSFLLATISSEVKLIDNDGERLIISIAALSLAISPFWMAAARRLHDQVPRRIKTFKQLLNTVWGKEIGAVGTALNSTKKAYSKAVDVIAEKRKSRENKDKEKPEEDA